MVNTTVTGQSAPDMGKKRQKLDGALGMNPSQLVNIAFRIYNREHRTKQEDAKTNAAFPAAALMGGNLSNLVDDRSLAEKDALSFSNPQREIIVKCVNAANPQSYC